MRRLAVSARHAWERLWRPRLSTWVPALLVFLVGLSLFGVYRLRYAGQVEMTAEAVTRGRQALASVRADRRHLEEDLEAILRTRQRLRDIYTDRLSTESRRLTRIIAEVKELARTSGLDPQAINYPDEPIEDFGLRKRSFVFGVEGTYAELRRLVNLLELSDSFLTLEEVRLVGGGDQRGNRGGGRLRIDLRLSTLFATETARLTAERLATVRDSVTVDDGAAAAEPVAEPAAATDDDGDGDGVDDGGFDGEPGAAPVTAGDEQTAPPAPADDGPAAGGEAGEAR